MIISTGHTKISLDIGLTQLLPIVALAALSNSFQRVIKPMMNEPLEQGNHCIYIFELA